MIIAQAFLQKRQKSLFTQIDLKKDVANS